MIVQDYKDYNGIKVFHPDVDLTHADYNAQGLDNLYKVEEEHFWFLARKEFIYQNIRKFISLNDKIIEIGAGTGNVSRFLIKQGYNNISVGEMHLNGLNYAKGYGIKDCYQFDLLKIPFEDEFDAVCMFDVLEHIKDDKLALLNVKKSLKQGGYMVLTVPAHQWLWNREDVIAGHKRRYEKKQLANKLESSGFEVVTFRYFFMSIIPLLYLRSILKKDTTTEVSQKEHNVEISINPVINKTLLFLSRLENKLNGFSPNLFGGSIFVIARRK